MSSLKNTLTEAMKDAMRAKAKFRLGVIRMVLADIKRVEVDERIRTWRRVLLLADSWRCGW